MQAPIVSVITPVGPAHAGLVGVALASVLGQSVQDIEHIIINDTGGRLGRYADPRVQLVEGGSSGEQGINRAARARNKGIAVARGTFTVFLDADDYLLPGALARYLIGHATHDKAYTYSSHYGTQGDQWSHSRPLPYDRDTMLKFNLHPITALVPTCAVREVGGFDEGSPGWEDWSIWLRLAQHGYCGEYVRGPTFVYRYDVGTNHVIDLAKGKALVDAARARHTTQYPEVMMGCGCGNGARVAKQIALQRAALLSQEIPMDGTMLEYTGEGSGSQIFRVPGSGFTVKAGRNAASRYVNVAGATEQDIAWLLDLGLFTPVPTEPKLVAPPAPVAPLLGSHDAPTDADQIARDVFGERDMDGHDAQPVTQPAYDTEPATRSKGRPARAS